MKSGKNTSEFILIGLVVVLSLVSYFLDVDFKLIAGELGLAGLYAVLRTAIKVFEQKGKNTEEISKLLPNVLKSYEEVKKLMASPSPPGPEG